MQDKPDFEKLAKQFRQKQGVESASAHTHSATSTLHVRADTLTPGVKRVLNHPRTYVQRLSSRTDFELKLSIDN